MFVVRIVGSEATVSMIDMVSPDKSLTTRVAGSTPVAMLRLSPSRLVLALQRSASAVVCWP